MPFALAAVAHSSAPPAQTQPSIEALPTGGRPGDLGSEIDHVPLLSEVPDVASRAAVDAYLRAGIFDADDVKDMLAIIHSSKADVSDTETEHPSMQGLYAAERKGIEGMMGELDGLLGGLLKRKGVVFT